MISELSISASCKLPISKSEKFGMESLSFQGSILRNTLNDKIKDLLQALKRKIKTRVGEKCNCRICTIAAPSSRFRSFRTEINILKSKKTELFRNFLSYTDQCRSRKYL